MDRIAPTFSRTKDFLRYLLINRGWTSGVHSCHQIIWKDYSYMSSFKGRPLVLYSSCKRKTSLIKMVLDPCMLFWFPAEEMSWPKAEHLTEVAWLIVWPHFSWLVEHLHSCPDTEIQPKSHRYHRPSPLPKPAWCPPKWDQGPLAGLGCGLL